MPLSPRKTSVTAIAPLAVVPTTCDASARTMITFSNRNVKLRKAFGATVNAKRLGDAGGEGRIGRHHEQGIDLIPAKADPGREEPTAVRGRKDGEAPVGNQNAPIRSCGAGDGDDRTIRREGGNRYYRRRIQIGQSEKEARTGAPLSGMRRGSRATLREPWVESSSRPTVWSAARQTPSNGTVKAGL